MAQSAVDLLDEVVALFEGAVSARESRAKTKTDQALAERGKRGEARQALLELILPVLADPGIPDEQFGGLLRGQIGMGRLREAAATNWPVLPRDHGRLSQMNASYTYLRQFAPDVLAAIDFQGGPGTAELMRAVSILVELNRTGARKVPASAPDEYAILSHRTPRRPASQFSPPRQNLAGVPHVSASPGVTMPVTNAVTFLLLGPAVVATVRRAARKVRVDTRG